MGNDHHCGLTRRAFVAGSLIGAGAAAMLPQRGARALNERTPPATNGSQDIIDVHHHPTIQSFRDVTGGPVGLMASWSVQRSLDDMARGGVGATLLSLPAPVKMWAEGREKAVARVREWNDYMASVVRDNPKRFGVLAALPVPYPDEALKEIEYAFETLKAVGIGITTNIGEKWLGDPLYAPIFQELDRRKAVVFVHPVAANCCQGLLPDISDPSVEFPTDTTRAIVRLIFSGAAIRFPNIRFIFSHAGGTMPFTVERLFLLPEFNKKLATAVPNGVLPLLQRFYYDVALSANPYAMSSLKKLVPVSQILFGTDFPFATATGTLKGLKGCGLFSDVELGAIGRGNAQALFPRLL